MYRARAHDGYMSLHTRKISVCKAAVEKKGVREKCRIILRVNAVDICLNGVWCGFRVQQMRIIYKYCILLRFATIILNIRMAARSFNKAVDVGNRKQTYDGKSVH